MLLLNTTAPKEVTKLLFISIHLMLLLNLLFMSLSVNVKNFNTSYVVIKLYTFRISTLWLYISIHLMLLLNEYVPDKYHPC